MARLFQTPGDDAHVVVAVAEDVVARRQAVLGALLLHFIELFHIEVVRADRSPVVRC